MSAPITYSSTTLTGDAKTDKAILDLLGKINGISVNSQAIISDKVATPATTAASTPWTVTVTQPTFISGVVSTPTWVAYTIGGARLRAGTGLSANIYVSEWNAGGYVVFTWGTPNTGSAKVNRFQSTTLTNDTTIDKSLLDILAKINSTSQALLSGSLGQKYASTTLTGTDTVDKALLDLIKKLNVIGQVAAPIASRTGISYTYQPTNAPLPVNIQVGWDFNTLSTGVYGTSCTLVNVTIKELATPPLASVLTKTGSGTYGGMTVLYSGGGSTNIGIADPAAITPNTSEQVWQTYNAALTLVANKTISNAQWVTPTAIGVDYVVATNILTGV